MKNLPLDPEYLKHRLRIIDRHRSLILEMRQVEKQIEEYLESADSRWHQLETQRNQIYSQVEPLIEEYWQNIPLILLSICPFCEAELRHPFDSVDLNGFWWMDRTQRPGPSVQACEHFQLLLGSLNLNGMKPEGGLFECCPGPDIPFVIPRLLEKAEMRAVISEIKMECGYIGYPIVYFSSQPVVSQDLSQSWARKEHRFKTEDGKAGWDIRQEQYDYDVLRWAHKKKVRWVTEGSLNSKEADPQQCLLFNIQGAGRNQSIRDQRLYYI